MDESTQLIEYELSVARHTKVSITDEAVRKVLEEMGRVLEKDLNGREDHDCQVSFKLKGDKVHTFDADDGVGIPESGRVVTPKQYQAVEELSWDVKIVKSIVWCGCLDTVGVNVIGCASKQGSILVKKYAWSEQANLWAHEFGHTAGLQHRDGEDPDTRALMAPAIIENRRNVSSAEREAFRTRESDAVSVACGQAPAWAPTPAGESPEVFERRLRSFVQATHVHGIPFAQAGSFGEEAIGLLGPWLSDPDFVLYWSTIALTLGAIGGPDALGILLEFIQREKRLDTRAGPGFELKLELEYEARAHAISALGFVASAQDGPGLPELADLAAPDAWTRATTAWIPADFHARVEPRLDYSAAALLGLALSGQAAARAKLLELRRSVTDVAFPDPVARESFLGVLETALRVNDDVREAGGLRAYYATKRR